LKGITCDELIAALKKDGWTLDEKTRKQHVYFKTGDDGVPRRVTIHYHPGKTYGANLLKGLLADIGWSADDMRRLKLIK